MVDVATWDRRAERANWLLAVVGASACEAVAAWARSPGVAAEGAAAGLPAETGPAVAPAALISVRRRFESSAPPPNDCEAVVSAAAKVGCGTAAFGVVGFPAPVAARATRGVGERSLAVVGWFAVDVRAAVVLVLGRMFGTEALAAVRGVVPPVGAARLNAELAASSVGDAAALGVAFAATAAPVLTASGREVLRV